MARVSVIVPARNAEGTLPRTLAALADQDLGDEYEVIVVDDGSTDRTVELAHAAAGPVTVMEQLGRGPGEARNRGVAAASGEALAFCDADVYPTAGWLGAGLRALESADLVQGKVLPDPTAPVGPYDRTLWITREHGLYETANLFSTRELFDRVGGFEEWLEVELGKAMAEDVWYGWKARRAGARTVFSEEALAHHAVFPRRWHEYVGERRRLRYFPAMAAKMPELREHFFFARLFLNKRSAAFDAAMAGIVTAAVLWSPLPLLAVTPYAGIAAGRARHHGRGGIKVAVADAIADAVGLAEMALGSIRYRSPLL